MNEKGDISAEEVSDDEMMSKNIQRVFVKSDDRATINCPECQLAKTVAVGKFRSNRHIIKVRCTCDHSFPVSLDFRKFYRKKTALSGTYATPTSSLDSKKSRPAGVYGLQTPTMDIGHILVTNVSCGGIQFTTPGSHTIKIGQEARIVFTLDDRRHTQISRRVIVQSVADNIIGCRFFDNEPLEQGLRFYLFP